MYHWARTSMALVRYRLARMHLPPVCSRSHVRFCCLFSSYLQAVPTKTLLAETHPEESVSRYFES